MERKRFCRPSERCTRLGCRACVQACILLVWISGPTWGQQSSCEVPVNVLAPDFSSLSAAEVEKLPHWGEQLGPGYFLNSVTMDFVGGQGLAYQFPWTVSHALPSDVFVARAGNHPAQVLSVRTDRGPRRVVFIVEDGKEMPQAARRIEVALITHILSRARPEDSFALLSAQGPRVEVRFGEGRDAVRAAAERLSDPPPRRSHGGVRDAILEATRWLQPPLPGDSIFVWALRLEGRHQVGFSKVRKAMSAGGARVFGFQLGDYSAEDLAIDSPERFSARYFDQMFTLSEATGGVTVEWNTKPPPRFDCYAASGPCDTVVRKFALTDDELTKLKEEAKQMYNAATEYEVLQLNSVRRGLNITLNSSAQKYLPQRLPVAMLLYPRYLPPCSAPASPAPGGTPP